MARLLKDRDAAALLGVSSHTLTQSRVSGTLLNRPAPRYFKIGSHQQSAVRYHEGELLAWVDEHFVAEDAVDPAQRQTARQKKNGRTHV